MKYFSDFFGNYYLMSAALAWLVAQLIKFFTELCMHKHIDFKKLTASGGMPSSHSSAACGLGTAVALEYGLNSAIFAACFVFGIIVMYDAAGVRRETGKQAKILNRMVADIMDKKPVYFQKELKELIGHTPLEVLAGAILGIAIAFAMYPYFPNVSVG